MAVLCDTQIRELIGIEPFEDNAKRPGRVSYGVSSYGYDVRVGTRFKVFTNAPSGGAAPDRAGCRGNGREIAIVRWPVQITRQRDENRVGQSLPLISHAASGIPIRRSQRKWDARHEPNDWCTTYLTPNSWHVSSTSLEIAG